jgi:hypothetical protein
MTQPNENTLFVCYCNGHDFGFLFDENLMERPKHKNCHATLWEFYLDESEEYLRELFKSMQSWFVSMDGYYYASMLEPFNKATPEQQERLTAKFERLKSIVGYVSEEDKVESREESSEDDPEADAKPEWLKNMLHVCYCNTCGEGVTYDEDVYTIPKEHEDCSTRLYQFDLTADPEKLKSDFRTMEGLFDCAMDGFSVIFLDPRRKASKSTRERLQDKFDELLTLVDFPYRPRRQNAESLYVAWCQDHYEGYLFDEDYFSRPNHPDCPTGLWTYDFKRDPKRTIIKLFQKMHEDIGSTDVSKLKPFVGATPEQEARILEKFAKLKELAGYSNQE